MAEGEKGGGRHKYGKGRKMLRKEKEGLKSEEEGGKEKRRRDGWVTIWRREGKERGGKEMEEEE